MREGAWRRVFPFTLLSGHSTLPGADCFWFDKEQDLLEYVL